MPIIIENIQTKERYRYPSVNANIETYEGFVQLQYVPEGFEYVDTPDSSDIMDFHHAYPSHKDQY